MKIRENPGFSAVCPKSHDFGELADLPADNIDV
jgi:hypothetical protein